MVVVGSIFRRCVGIFYQVCSSVVNNTLQSPGYPSDYPRNTDCVYRVAIPCDKELVIYFNYFHLEYASSCVFDYLRISDGSNRVIGTYCGQETGRSVLVNDTVAVLFFHTDPIVQYDGFHLSFSFFPLGCGSVQNGSLRTPAYPNYYPSNVHCVYRISIPHGKDLIIYFNYFNLESHSNCSYDYLRIANGINDTIGVFCGQQIGNWVRVTGNFAEITFHSNSIVQRKGYELFFSYSGYPVSCNFDSGLCLGWHQSQFSDVFDWKSGTGGTPSFSTGPSSDHTTGSGYYMFIETSFPRQQGDNAELELFLPGNGELGCFSFYYHMYGADMGTLHVFSGKMIVFNESGNQGNIWRKAEGTIALGHKLTFEAIRGSSSWGDLAIDDVLITNGSCLGGPSPPPPPAPEPKEPSEEERLESVITEIQGLNTSEWNEPKEDAFKQSVAEAATRLCANDGNCIPSRPRFNEDQVHLLPGYPKQVSQVPLLAVIAFYLQTPPGSLSSVINKNVLVAIVKSSVAEISSTINANISNVRQLFDDTTTTTSTNTSPVTPTVPPGDKNPNTTRNAIIGGVIGSVAFVIVIVVVWCLCKWKKRCLQVNSEISHRGEEKNDSLRLEMDRVTRTEDIGN
ncbi:uncharacterized protein [Montipora capricornis]|uniref:uncharacterized protein isoform X2 n=1 Tax=Montipora foliosa TaxID=591990 RepID=UPI0035F1FDA8